MQQKKGVLPMLLEHLHQHSVCGSALEILDEVQQQSNPVKFQQVWGELWIRWMDDATTL
jgi:hypothetical protein